MRVHLFLIAILSAALANAQNCVLTLTPDRADFDTPYGTGFFEVQASTPDCVWQARASQSFITVQTGSTPQTGDGLVTFVLAQNTAGRAAGSITVTSTSGAQVVFNVSYPGACSPPGEVYPGRRFGQAGGSGYLLMPAGAGCSITPFSTVSWLTFGPRQSDLIPFTVAPMSSTVPRSGSILVDGLDIVITQEPVTLAGASLFYPVPPCRVLDTRNGDVPLLPGVPRTLRPEDSPCGLPSTVSSYSFNVTVVPPGRLGYLSSWPSGTTQPFVSTLNATAGGVVANAAVVPAGIEKWVDFFATDRTHLVVDANGYFGPPGFGGLAFFPVPPCRLVETRNATPIARETSRTFSTNGCAIPPNALAISANATVVPSEPLGFLTLWPGGPRPLVSTLNSPFGQVVANAALVPVSSASINAYASNTTHLVLDVNGYFAPPATGGLQFYAVAPCRAVDTRNAGGPLVANESRVFSMVQSNCGISPAASAVVVNATVVPSGILGYLTLWPAGLPQPLVSTLNSTSGNVVANMAVVPLGANAALSAFVTHPSHLILDVLGYFGP